MKKYFKKRVVLIVILPLIIILGCNRPEAPIFETIREVKIKEQTDDLITITAFADFYNPNNYKIILKKADIDLLLNDKKISSLEQDFDLKIEKQSKFTVPLEATFSQSQINENLISSAIKILMGRKLTINYIGNIKVKAYGVRIKVPINGESKIDIREF